jgi:hypothetical protein
VKVKSDKVDLAKKDIAVSNSHWMNVEALGVRLSRLKVKYKSGH